MGYTHYFEQSRPVTLDEWQAISKDALTLIENLPSDVAIATKGDQAFYVNEETIFFNGCDPATGDSNKGEDLGHETFTLYRDGRPQVPDYRKQAGHAYPFTFCKTARKPYDLLVCAVLIVADHYAPDAYDIGSDGDPEDWQGALDWTRLILGDAYDLPSRLLAEATQASA